MNTWENIGKKEKMMQTKRKPINMWDVIEKLDQMDSDKTIMHTWENIELVNPQLLQGTDENPQKQPNSLKDLISKFHRIVNNGPVYVCICCDQLWYKHSVHSAAKLRERNPNIV